VVAATEPSTVLGMSSDSGPWHIGEVAHLSGVTTRTLRHYGDIGLLLPCATGADGTRYYGRAELLRLQRILLLRELGLGLAHVAEVIDGDVDELTALRRHRDEYATELERRREVLATIDATIENVTQGAPMRPEDLFDGFDPEQQERWEAELVGRYGDEARARIDSSRQRTSTWQRADADAAVAGFDRAEAELAHLCADHVPVDDPRVQRAVEHHYVTVCRFWTPDADAYAGLGQMYVDHPDFRARYESRQVGLSEYLRDAMTVYAVSLPGTGDSS